MVDIHEAPTRKVKLSHPLPHDGWKSRAVIFGGSLIILTIVGTTVVVAADKVDQFMVVAPWLRSTVTGFLGIVLGSTTIKGVAEAIRSR